MSDNTSGARNAIDTPREDINSDATLHDIDSDQLDSDDTDSSGSDCSSNVATVATNNSINDSGNNIDECLRYVNGILMEDLLRDDDSTSNDTTYSHSTDSTDASIDTTDSNSSNSDYEISRVCSYTEMICTCTSFVQIRIVHLDD